jgi:carbon storage regulator CsrA
MALTISRRLDQRVWIGPHISVTITRIRAGRRGRGDVRLTIDAPQDLRILRDELRRAGLALELPLELAGETDQALAPLP